MADDSSGDFPGLSVSYSSGSGGSSIFVPTGMEFVPRFATRGKFAASLSAIMLKRLMVAAGEMFRFSFLSRASTMEFSMLSRVALSAADS